MKEKVQIGMHASIAGGLSKAVSRTVATASECFQIFARNPRGWLARPLELEEISEFKTARENAGLWPLAVHTVYLVNLAASDPVLLARSRDAFREEIMRSLALGADYLVVHPGSAGRADVELGIATAVESIRQSVRGLGLRGAPAKHGADSRTFSPELSTER